MSQEQINFEKTELPIPESVLKLPIEKQNDIYNYLIQMNEYQKKSETKLSTVTADEGAATE